MFTKIVTKPKIQGSLFSASVIAPMLAAIPFILEIPEAAAGLGSFGMLALVVFMISLVRSQKLTIDEIKNKKTLLSTAETWEISNLNKGAEYVNILALGAAALVITTKFLRITKALSSDKDPILKGIETGAIISTASSIVTSFQLWQKNNSKMAPVMKIQEIISPGPSNSVSPSLTSSATPPQPDEEVFDLRGLNSRSKMRTLTNSTGQA